MERTMESQPLAKSDWMLDVVARHEAPLARYATRITRCADSARDVVQDVFAKLCRDAPADLNGQLAPWLYAACRNRAIDVRRKDSRAVSGDAELFAIADPGGGPVDAAVIADESAKVMATLATLPASQQEAVCLRFSHGLRYAEIAKVMEISVSHVGVLLHTAIASLRERHGQQIANDRAVMPRGRIEP